MNRFNLTFKGEILLGRKPEQVKVRFGKMFAINDPVRLEQFFSGDTIILRRNLDRKTAAEYFQKMRKLGVAAELVRVTTQDAVTAITKATAASPADSSGDVADNTTGPVVRGMDQEIMQRSAGQVDQSWAVSSTNTQRPTGKKQSRAARDAAKREAKQAARRAQRERQQREAEEKAAQQQALQEEAKRKAAEKAARQQALQEEAARKAAEEAARQQALREEAERKAAEEAARQQALREEAARKAAEEAARQQALREEAARKAAEEAARQRILREEAERKAAEEAARRKAELAELKRKKAEKAALLKEEKRRRKAAERARLEEQRAREAARQKAIQEEARRKAAEETARHKAELARKKRIEAQEAARVKAELASKKRQAAEEAARKQAIVEEAKRKAAAEAATLQAEQEEQARKAAAELAQLHAEQKRQEAASVALLAAEREEQARLKREQKDAQQSEDAAKAAAQETVRKEEKRKAAARSEKNKAIKALEKRQKAEQATRRKAEESRHKQALQARLKAQQDEQAAQRIAMEEQAVQRAAAELSQQPSLKPVNARVKTNLDLPVRHNGGRQNTPTHRRQPGEPNIYSLRPFRNTPEVRARAEQSRQRMRRGFSAALLGLGGLLILGGLLLGLPATQPITGAGAMAIDAQARPVLLAGKQLLFHDRSGAGTGTVSLESLGLVSLQAPMAFNTVGELFALGHLSPGAAGSAAGPLQLLRCRLPESGCEPFSSELQNSTVAGFAIHPLDDAVFVADSAAGQLLKMDRNGKLVARGKVSLSERPILQLHAGLLFLNSATGPAISVLRYDDSAFGQQLDEILLLPPAAMETGQSRVGPFIWSADAWWTSMYNPETGSAGLYRFDTQWNFSSQVKLAAGTAPRQLVNWGEKTLVGDSHQIGIQRFNAQGEPEVPMVSNLLEQLVGRQQRAASLTGLAWRIGLMVLAIMTIAGFFIGNLQRLRSLVYKTQRARGAESVDEYADAVLWIAPVDNRKALLRRTGFIYAIASAGLVLLAISQSVSTLQLAALLIALSGPAVALTLLGKSPAGHLGIVKQQLLLVDPTGMYHLGGGPDLQYHGSFLLIDDVVVFTGNRLLPAFSADQVKSLVTPLATGGIKIDRNTVLVKLLQCRHPLIQGTAVILAAGAIAAVLLCLQGVL